MSSRVLVTAALPYANGSIHLGHMLEAIQTDVYVRARRMAGEDVIFMWADDTHGTPIQVRARKEGITPEELISKAYDEHVNVFDGFGIGYDIYHSTHSPENVKHATAIYNKMVERGDIESRTIEQLYCEHDTMFLPDRFVRGTCPKCGTDDQYGDACESCGSTYDTTDVKSPKCSLCGTEPTLRPSEHLFVPLGRHEDFIRKWLSEENNSLPASVRNYVMNWVNDGLRDWDISRDKPYFGIEIPGHPGKYFYVWFDAPIGYISATDKWCTDNGVDFDQYWHDSTGETEIVHVIGKDIVYFHSLFWPAVLNAAGYTIPSQVQVHGWVTVNGEKMSKSRGTFILGSKYLKHLPPDYLRYYYASKLSSSQDDMDFNIEDFANKVDAEMVNKAANLASRCMKFINSKLGGTLGELPDEAAAIVDAANVKLGQVADLYRNFEIAKAIRLAMEVAEDANQFVTDQAPWKLAKTDPERARAICSVGVYASKIVAAIFKPVLPDWAKKMESMLHLSEPLTFTNGGDRLPSGHKLGAYEILAERIDRKQLAMLIEPEPEDAKVEGGDDVGEFDEARPELMDEVKIDAFTTCDLRVGKVLECKTVDGSDKLLQFKVDLGPLGYRNIFSGIAKNYAPEGLIGKHVAVFANLKPRKMRFGISEGMILACGEEDPGCTVVELDPASSRPGEKIT